MLEESTGNFSAARNIYDWYQNQTHVIINIMIKNLKEEDVDVKLIDDALDVTCKLADGRNYNLHFNLFKPIFVTESTWHLTPSKLEIRLKKTDKKRWQSLELLPEIPREKHLANGQKKSQVSSIVSPQYQAALQAASTVPRSSVVSQLESADVATAPTNSDVTVKASKTRASRTKDWDALAREVEEEEQRELEQAGGSVDALFKSIYAKADDDTRRAMMKSFIESKGTVLSTNWKEVGTKTIEVNPPEGVEERTWD